MTISRTESVETIMAKAGKTEKQTKANKHIDIQFLAKLTCWRNEAQVALFELLNLVVAKQEKIKRNERHNAIFQLLTGTAFSLWRAVFLSDFSLDSIEALDAAKTFLNKVVSDNAIGYPQEKESRLWVAGFYVSHIQYRMYHLHTVYGKDLKVTELDHFVKNWNPINHLNQPPIQNNFLGVTADCLRKLTARLDKLIG
jgi:hypothetical protein